MTSKVTSYDRGVINMTSKVTSYDRGVINMTSLRSFGQSSLGLSLMCPTIHRTVLGRNSRVKML